MVVHCAAVSAVAQRGKSVSKDYLSRVNVDAVGLLAQACVSAGVRRLIFLSSAKVYGESSTAREPFRETDRLLPEDQYARSKVQAETILKSADYQPLQVCALRLPLVYGAGAGGNFRTLQRLALSGLPLPLAGIDNRRSVLSTQNLVAVVKALLQRDKWPFMELNVADPEPISVPELIRCLADSVGKRARLLNVPVPLLAIIGRMLGQKQAVDRIVGDLELDTDRLKGEVPEASLVETGQALLCMNQELSPSRKGWSS